MSTRSNSIITYDVGFHYIAYRMNDGSNNPEVYLFVTYVKPGTIASNILKRGDFITEVNGNRLRAKDFNTVLTSNNMLKLTLNYTDEVTLFLAQNYQEDPLFLSKTLEADGKKIGYMVYNHFANGPDNEDYSWGVEVNNALTKFKSDGISELILDLRYNRGGYVESGTYIASAIAPNRSGKIYTKSQYNDKLEANSSFKNRKNNYFQDYIKNGDTRYDIPQLNLSRLIVITSQETASASEQIINGLRAYMNVEVLGQTTIGKNQESFELLYEGPEAILSLHPIVAITYRSDIDDPTQNDYSKGFKPTIGLRDKEADEILRIGGLSSQFGKFYVSEAAKMPLGDTEETLLKLALDFIKTGERTPTIEKTTRSNGSLLPTPMMLESEKPGAILTKVEE